MLVSTHKKGAKEQWDKTLMGDGRVGRTVVSIGRLAAFYVVFIWYIAAVSPSDVDVYEIQYNSYVVSINGEVHL